MERHKTHPPPLFSRYNVDVAVRAELCCCTERRRRKSVFIPEPAVGIVIIFLPDKEPLPAGFR